MLPANGREAMVAGLAKAPTRGGGSRLRVNGSLLPMSDACSGRAGLAHVSTVCPARRQGRASSTSHVGNHSAGGQIPRARRGATVDAHFSLV